MSWLHELHANLLMSGRTGRWLNGIGGLLLVLLCITGIVIWWPGRTKWARTLVVDIRANWKRVVFDLHNATGVWLLVPIAVLALTGSSFTWPREFRAVISWLSPITPNETPKSDVTKRGSLQVSLERIVLDARNREPHLRLVRVAIPGRPELPYTVFFAAEHSDAPRDMTRHYFDQHTGAWMTMDRRGSSQTMGDALAGWLGPLHTGNFGGLGIKVLWAALGLAPALLFATGFLMWWNRVVKRAAQHMRARRRQDLSSSPAASRA